MTFIINLTFTKCQMVIRPGTRKFSISFFPYTSFRGNYYACNISSYVQFSKISTRYQPIFECRIERSDRMINRQLRDRDIVFYAENNNRKGTIGCFSPPGKVSSQLFPIHREYRISKIITIIIIIIIIIVVIVNRKTRGGKDKMEGKDEGV